LIGRATFTIRGLIVREPSRDGEFSLGPARADRLRRPGATGRFGFGSRARRAMLVKMPRIGRALVKTLREDFKDDFINTRSSVPARIRSVVTFDRAGKLPEPGRADHRDPRRHRGVERDPGVHPAETPPHRGAECLGRAADRSSRLYPPGQTLGWPAACSAWRWRAASYASIPLLSAPRPRSWPRRTTASAGAPPRRAIAIGVLVSLLF